MKVKKKSVLGILLSLAMVLEMMPGMEVRAENTVLNSASDYTGFADMVYSDNTIEIDGVVKDSHNVKWYVIGYQAAGSSTGTGVATAPGTVTLLAAEDLLLAEKFSDNSNKYRESYLKSLLDGEGGLMDTMFSGISEAIHERTLSVTTSIPDNYIECDDIYDTDSTPLSAKLWPLSAKEASMVKAGNQNILGDSVSDWWLRSPGNYEDRVAMVYGGELYPSNITDNLNSPITHSVRPALQLDLSKIYFSNNSFSMTEAYPTWIGGVQVTSDSLSGNGWTYTPATTSTPAKLVLNGYSYKGDGHADLDKHYSGAAIYSEESLAIELKGDNTVESTYSSGYGINLAFAEETDKYNLTISGSGKLTSIGGNIGICASGDITINGGTVTATGTTNAGIVALGNYMSAGGGKVIINDGTVTSTGQNFGINSFTGVIISGGTVTASGGSDNPNIGGYAIGASQNAPVTISGGTITATSDFYGMYSNDIITIGNCSITVSGAKQAIKGKVKNSITGLGWTDTNGTQGKTKIEISSAGQELPDYKKVQFPNENVPVGGITPPTAKNLTYNGSAQELVTAGSAQNGTMKYAIGSNDTTAPTTGWTTTIPTKADAGTYYVWYKAEGEAYQNSNPACCGASVISPQSITGATVTLDNTSFTHTGSEHAVNVTSVKLGNATLNPTDYDVSGTTKATNTGNYSVTVTGKGNYKDTATAQWSITAGQGNQTNISTDIESHDNTPQTTMEAVSAEVIMNIATPEEQARINNGEKAVLIVEIENVDSTISSGDRQLMENNAKSLNPNAVVGMYMNITMKLVVGNTSRQITDTNGNIVSLLMKIPDALLPPAGTARTFYVSSIHDGVAKNIASTQGTEVKIPITELSTFAIIYSDEAQATTQATTEGFNTSIKIKQKSGKLVVSWDKVEGVSKVEVYLTYCGKSYSNKPTKTTTGNKVTIKKIKGKKLDFKKNFKLKLVAYDSSGKRIGKSIGAHFTGKENEKYTNPKSIKLSKNSLTLSVGQTGKVKATIKLEDNSKSQLSNKHAEKVRYRSTNSNIAKVDKKGNITGVKAGTCEVYVYAKNGLAKKVKVTVN